ncbi:hypothetical protein [Porphyromonas circumdentaria]|uniref:hypothetical protein n=1 Tax=Porphyromonas circumdentaria TaxID=29524 RepID=UPI0026DC2058|nr:hypothetical protein [Porphyromonas circumdentaria]MDO4722619.1 hypothetical protein [Porphyromonas circumdentaria]
MAQAITPVRIHALAWLGTPVGMLPGLMIYIFEYEPFDLNRLTAMGITVGIVLLLCFLAARILYRFSDKKFPPPSVKELLSAVFMTYVPSLLFLLMDWRAYWLGVILLGITVSVSLACNAFYRIGKHEASAFCPTNGNA